MFYSCRGCSSNQLLPPGTYVALKYPYLPGHLCTPMKRKDAPCCLSAEEPDVLEQAMPLCQGSPQQPVHQLCDQQDFGVTFWSIPCCGSLLPSLHPLELTWPCGSPLPLLYCILACPGTYCRYEGWRLLFTNSIGTNTALDGDVSRSFLFLYLWPLAVANVHGCLWPPQWVLRGGMLPWMCEQLLFLKPNSGLTILV